MNNLLDLTAPPGERPVEIPDLPPSAETSLMKLEGMWILHIVRSGAVAPPELRDLEVTLRPDFGPPRVCLGVLCISPQKGLGRSLHQRG